MSPKGNEEIHRLQRHTAFLSRNSDSRQFAKKELACNIRSMIINFQLISSNGFSVTTLKLIR